MWLQCIALKKVNSHMGGILFLCAETNIIIKEWVLKNKFA